MKRFMILFMLLLLLALGATTVSATPADVDSSDVFWWWGEQAGTATIVRTDGGISGTYSSSMANDVGSMQGYALTLWLVIFNDPAACGDPSIPDDPCGDADFGNPAVMIDVVYASGHIVGGSELANFAYHLQEGDSSGSIAHLFGLPTNDGEPWGLVDARGAEIHYVVRTHGPAVPGNIKSMIQSYPGGCVFNHPYGHPFPLAEGELQLGVGDCQDIQFAVNVAH